MMSKETKLPNEIPCPRCNAKHWLGVRKKVEGQICYVYFACACGIRIEAAGNGDAPEEAEARCLAELRRAWKRTRTLWEQFQAVASSRKMHVEDRVTVNQMHQVVMQFGKEAPDV